MNLSAYLQMRVTPLSEYVPERTEKKVVRHVISEKQRFQIDRLKETNEALRMKTVEQYRRAMGKRWMRTTDIEIALEKGIGTALGTLRKWEKAGLIESRLIGTSRRQGFEWRLL